jgi:outer membrane lipoprotein carrier protein
LEACKRTDSEKSWLRLLHRIEPNGVRLALLLTFASPAQQLLADTPTAAAAEPPALERFLDQAKSLKAEFSQEVWNGEQLVESASGELALERPNRFRWQYRTPIEQLIVADGSRLWMYDVELAQVTVAPLDAPAASSPALLLSGDQAVRDGFDVVDSFTLDGISWVRLKPKLPDTDFRSVLLGFRDDVPTRLEMVDGLNQVTRIEFTDVELNPVLADTLFEFTPPPGADVIGEP